LKRENPGEPVTTINILDHLVKTLDGELTDLHRRREICLASHAKAKDHVRTDESDEVDETEGADEPVEVDEAVKERLSYITEGSAERILRLAFPDGAEELPIRTSKGKAVAWGQIKNALAPRLASAAGYLAGLKKLPDSCALAAKPENAMLGTLVQETSRVVAEWGSELAANREFADLLAKNACKYLKVTDERLPGWIANQIVEGSASNHPVILKLFQQLGVYTEKGMTYILSNLSQGIPAGEDATKEIILKLLPVLTNFVNANKDKKPAIDAAAVKAAAAEKKLAEKAEELKAQGLVPEEQEGYIALKEKCLKLQKAHLKVFESLAIQLQAMCGLQGKPGVLPDSVNEHLTATLPFEMAKILAKQYERYLVPLAEMYQSILNPQPPVTRAQVAEIPNGPALVRQCQRAGELVTTNGRQVVEVYQSWIVRETAEAIASEASDLKGILYRETKEVLEEPLPQLSREVPAPPSQLEAMEEGDEEEEGFAALAAAAAPGVAAAAREKTLLDKGGEADKMKALEGGLAKWLDNLITGARTSKDPRIAKIWEYLGFTTEGLLQSILLKADADTNHRAQNPVAAVSISEKLLEELSDFIKNNKTQIDAAVKAAKGAPTDLELQSAYYNTFAPLAKSVLELTGFQKGLKVFPDFLCEHFTKVLIKQFSKLLSQQYKQYLVPLNDLHETILQSAIKHQATAPAVPEETSETLLGPLQSMTAPAVQNPPPAAAPLPRNEIAAKGLIDEVVSAGGTRGEAIAHKLVDIALEEAKKPDIEVALNIVAALSGDSAAPPPVIGPDATPDEKKGLQTWVADKVVALTKSSAASAVAAAAVAGPAAQPKVLSMTSFKAGIREILINILDKAGASSAGTAGANPLQYHFDNLTSILEEFLEEEERGKTLYDLYSKLPVRMTFIEFMEQQGKKVEAMYTEVPNEDKLQENLGANYELMTEEGKAFYDLYIKLPEKSALDEAFIAMFQPLADGVLKYVTNNIPLPKLLMPLVENYLQTKSAAFFAKQYRPFLSADSQLKDSKDDLIRIFTDEFNQKIVTKNEEEKDKQKIANDIKSKELVQQIDTMCTILVGEIISAGEKAINKKLGKVIGKEMSILVPGFEQKPYIHNVVKAFLMQTIAHYTKQVQASGGKLADTSALTEMLTTLGTILHKHLTNPTLDIDAALAKPTPEERLKAIKTALTPLTLELIELFNLNDASIPFVDLSTLLPDLFADMCLETTPWYMKAPELRGALMTRVRKAHAIRESVREAGNLPDACSQLSEWITEMVPAMLKLDSGSLSEKVFDVIQEYLSESGNTDGGTVANYLSQNGEPLKMMISNLLATTFARKSAAMAFGREPAKKYLEALLLQACNGLTQRIDESENSEFDTSKNPKVKKQTDAPFQKNFLVNLGMRLVQGVSNHLETLNLVTKNTNKSSILDIKPSKFVKVLREHNRKIIEEILMQSVVTPPLHAQKQAFHDNFEQALPIVMDFLKKHRSELQKLFLQLGDPGEDPGNPKDPANPDPKYIEKHAEYIQKHAEYVKRYNDFSSKFEPLCAELEKHIENDMSIPRSGLDEMKEFLEENGPGLFADKYHELTKLHPHIPSSDEIIKTQKEYQKVLKHLGKLNTKLQKIEDSPKEEHQVKAAKYKQEIADTEKTLSELKDTQYKARVDFFKPLGETIFELVDIKPEDIPIPAVARDLFLDQVKNEIMPKVLANVSETLLAPNTINQIVISSLTAMQDVIKEEDKVEGEFHLIYRSFKNAGNILHACNTMAADKSQTDLSLKAACLAAATDNGLKVLDKLLDPHKYRKTINELRECDYDEIIAKYDGITGITENFATIRANIEAIQEIDAVKNAPAGSKLAQIRSLVKNANDALKQAEDKLTLIFKGPTGEEGLIGEAKINKDLGDGQKQLNKDCGKLIKQFLKISRNTFITWVFKIFKLEDMTDSYLGRIIYKQLQMNWTILKMGNVGAGAAIDSLEGMLRNKSPEDKAEFATTADRKMKEEQENKAKAIKMMVDTARTTIVETLTARVKNKFESAWEFEIHENISLSRLIYRFPRVEKWLKKIGEVLGTILSYISRPIGYLVDIIWTHFPYWGAFSKAEALLQGAYHGSHETLLFSVLEELFATLQGERIDWSRAGAVAAVKTKEDAGEAAAIASAAKDVDEAEEAEAEAAEKAEDERLKTKAEGERLKAKTTTEEIAES